MTCEEETDKMVFVLVCKIQGATLSEPITGVEYWTAQVVRDIYGKIIICCSQ